jgi:hypothetical protein
MMRDPSKRNCKAKQLSNIFLARIVAFILAASATSSDVERVFSMAGGVMTKARASSSPFRLDRMVCLHDWLAKDELLSGVKYAPVSTNDNIMKAAKRQKTAEQ